MLSEMITAAFRAFRVYRSRFVHRLSGDTRHGSDILEDVRRLHGWPEEAIIFDVGANIGQSTVGFSDAFPRARIFAFEPSSQNFSVLRKEVASRERIHCFQRALGKEAGEAKLYLHERPSQHSLRRDVIERSKNPMGTHEIVTVTTVDDVMNEHGIDHVHLLKIDAEGFDLQIVKGARDALERGAIGAIQVEAGIGQDQGLFEHLDNYLGYLQPRGYLLSGLYDQVRSRSKNRLYRFDAVFAPDRLGERPDRVEDLRGLTTDSRM